MFNSFRRMGITSIHFLILPDAVCMSSTSFEVHPFCNAKSCAIVIPVCIRAHEGPILSEEWESPVIPAGSNVKTPGK